MSKIIYQRVSLVPKLQAIIALLSNPGTAIQGGNWNPDEWYSLEHGENWGVCGLFVVDENGHECELVLDNLSELWWIMEPTTEVSKLEAELTELIAKLEALNAKIAAAKEAQS